MTILTLALFIPACFALNMVPGPNNLLAMSNAQRYGFQSAVAAGIGRLAAFSVMILLAATGLAAILHTSETLFLTIKIVGALYLFWVAYQLWNANVVAISQQTQVESSIYQLAKQEFLLAAGNPKAVLIFTAFLPQFIDSTQKSGYQFFMLGLTFLCLELLAVSIYACFGVYLRHWFSKPSMRKLFNRGCAALIGSIGIGLMLEADNSN